MSGKKMKLLRRFNKNMKHDASQQKQAKRIYKGLSEDNKTQLTREMRQFNNVQAQSIEGMAE